MKAARDYWGLEPAQDFCIQNNFGVRWEPKKVPDQVDQALYSLL